MTPGSKPPRHHQVLIGLPALYWRLMLKGLA